MSIHPSVIIAGLLAFIVILLIYTVVRIKVILKVRGPGLRREIGVGLLAGIASGLVVAFVAANLTSYIESSVPKSTLAPSTSPDELSVRITVPANNQSVQRFIDVSGTSNGIRPEQRIWVFVLYPGDYRVYPQDTAATLHSDGTWTSKAALGTQSQQPATCGITAAVLDPDGVNAVAEYLKTAAAKDYPGMDTLPIGTQASFHIDVTCRKESA